MIHSGFLLMVSALEIKMTALSELLRSALKPPYDSDFQNRDKLPGKKKCAATLPKAADGTSIVIRLK